MTDSSKPSPSERILASRRKFLAAAGLAAPAVLAAPAIVGAQAPIRWRLQTYAGPSLGEHVIKRQVDAFNAAANGEMEIELYYADQLVPTSELFRALQNGTLDAISRMRPPWRARRHCRVRWLFPVRYALQPDIAPCSCIMARRSGRKPFRSQKCHLSLDRRLDPLHVFTVYKPVRSLAISKDCVSSAFPTAAGPVTLWLIFRNGCRRGQRPRSAPGPPPAPPAITNRTGPAPLVGKYALSNAITGLVRPLLRHTQAGRRCRRICSSSTARPSISRTITA